MYFVGMLVLMVGNLKDAEFKPSVSLTLLLPETVCSWRRTRWRITLGMPLIIHSHWWPIISQKILRHTHCYKEC